MGNILRSEVLQIQFWDQDDVPEGFSEWAVFRIDKEDFQLPDDAEMQRLFQEATGTDGNQLSIRTRIAMGAYLYMPQGIRRSKRLAFLQAIEKKLGM